MGNYFLSQFENYSPEIHFPPQRFLSLHPFLKHTSSQNLLTFKATSCLVAFQKLRPVHTRCDLYRTILLYYCVETKEIKPGFPLDREIVGFKQAGFGLLWRDQSQLTFPEFHFETEAKVDFPSACI